MEIIVFINAVLLSLIALSCLPNFLLGFRGFDWSSSVIQATCLQLLFKTTGFVEGHLMVLNVRAPQT